MTSTFPRDIWRIIFFHAGPLSFAVLRVVCCHFKNIIDSREFKELVADNPQCIISQRQITWDPADFLPQYDYFRLNTRERIAAVCGSQETLQFLPLTYSVGGDGCNLNLPNTMAIEMDATNSAKSLDAFFPDLKLTTITEPETVWKCVEAEVDDKLFGKEIQEDNGSEMQKAEVDEELLGIDFIDFMRH